MALIARKNLFQEKTRFLITIGGVTFAVFLILIVQALYQGWNHKMSAYIESLSADIWVLEEGTRDMFHSFSLVSQDLMPIIAEMPGVTDVRPFIGRQVGFELDGEKTSFFLVSFDTAKDKGGPVNMIKGRRIPGPRELVVDIAFTKNHGLDIGDSISLNNQSFKIAGISEGGNMIVFQYAFARKEDALSIINLGQPPKALKRDSKAGQQLIQTPTTSNLANYILINTDKDQSTAVRESLIQKFPDYVIKTNQEFITINQALIRDSFLPIIFVLDIVGFLVGVAVIGLTVYTATIEKKEEYGVLKALGAKNSYLIKIVFQQSLIAAAVGFSVAMGLAVLATIFIPRMVPAFQTLLRWPDVLSALGATLLMSIVATYGPIRQILRIDPAKVFRA